MKLVIVESPSKSKTIEKYLGKEYAVLSSIGHVRDLPKSNKDALDIESGFVPNYVISAGKQKVVDQLQQKAAKADEVLLATDPDREGEAIAWHLEELLKEDKKVTAPIKRITFNEITEDAVKEALKHPRDVDTNLRKAQEARRVLDRLVGYDLSGLIWKKLRYGLSAGRVQSPALRILMEREREIRAFIPDDYFVLTGIFEKAKMSFPLVCEQEPGTQKEADRIVELGKKSTWHVVKVKESEAKRNPRSPFTTSTLQQAASTRLGMSPSNTMRVAQKLYEAGHITYMRTDSSTLSKQAVAQISTFIKKEYGDTYLEVKTFTSKSKNAQEAHEAIRPTKFGKIKRIGTNEEQKQLYELIWERTVASQMAPAKLLKTKLSANITTPDSPPSQGGAGGGVPNFSTTGSRVIFDGWLKADPRARSEDTEVPKVAEGDELKLKDIDVEAKQTQPPNRYTEAGLVKELEKRGIGRPSTYASIMQTLQNRGYVNKEGRTLFPTDTGDVVSSFLEENFMDYISDDFTAEMENELDDIANGERDYKPTLKDFYGPFLKAVQAKEDIPKISNLGSADKKFKCPKCKSAMVIKLGRTGKFLSCEKYPDCDGALTIEGQEIGDEKPFGKHPETGENIYLLTGRFGPYVQLGETPEIPKKTKFPKGHRKTDEEKELVKKENEAIKAAKELPKPKRASLPKGMKPEDITLDQAVHLLILPRELGTHPESGETVIANVGRFGPYVGHGREFRSIKKNSGLDPYTITFKQAVDLLNQPKPLPKGAKLVKEFGKHPKTGKDLRVLESKSGKFVQKGLRRVYLPDNAKVQDMSVEELVALIDAS
jgi:DNA topoisomerase-1